MRQAFILAEVFYLIWEEIPCCEWGLKQPSVTHRIPRIRYLMPHMKCVTRIQHGASIENPLGPRFSPSLNQFELVVFES
jgi:hypothetical protein